MSAKLLFSTAKHFIFIRNDGTARLTVWTIHLGDVYTHKDRLQLRKAEIAQVRISGVSQVRPHPRLSFLASTFPLGRQGGLGSPCAHTTPARSSDSSLNMTLMEPQFTLTSSSNNPFNTCPFIKRSSFIWCTVPLPLKQSQGPEGSRLLTTAGVVWRRWSPHSSERLQTHSLSCDVCTHGW